MSLTRPLGTTLPVADATISTWPKVAQSNARQKSATIVPPIARPIGDGGVSTISSAAGKKASSSNWRRPRETGKVMIFLVTASAALADFMKTTLETTKGRVATTPAYQFIMRTVLDEAPVIERENAIREAHR